MARTPSNMIPLGSKAPEFTLPDTVSGENISLADYVAGKPFVVMFICNHCPYVIRIAPELAVFASEYQKRGVAFIAISSNDVENYPQDSPDLMKENAAENGYPFPYLYDESQSVARDYDAACTPDFYLYDKDAKLVYRGQFDDARPSNDVKVTGRDLGAAIDALLAGKAVSEQQTPSLGCNIKWKAA